MWCPRAGRGARAAAATATAHGTAATAPRSIAANFVDGSNCAAAAADLGLMARRAAAPEHEDRGAAAAVAGLDELDEVALSADDARSAAAGFC